MTDRQKLDDFLHRLDDEIGPEKATDEEKARFARKRKSTVTDTGTATLPTDN